MSFSIIFLFIVFTLGDVSARSKSFNETIWFTATGETRTLSEVGICSVSTACRFNPRYRVVLVSTVPMEAKLSGLKEMCPGNLYFHVTTTAELLTDTPLLSWYKKAKKRNGKFLKADLSDAWRTALIYKFGGVYFDLDMLSLASIDNVPSNAMGQQLEGVDKKDVVPFVNGAALIFDPQHPFMERVMKDFEAMWNPKIFGTVGPDLLWETYQNMKSEAITQMSIRYILPTVLPKAVFYPIKFKAHPLKVWFARPAPPLPWFSSETVAVHLWSHLTSKFTITNDSRGGQLLAKCNDVSFLSSTKKTERE